MASPLQRYQYDDWSFVFSFTQAGAPLNLTGYTFIFEIFDKTNNNVATVNNGSMTITVLTGIVTVPVPRATTAGIVSGSYGVWLQWHDGSGLRKTPVANYPLIVLAGKPLF